MRESNSPKTVFSGALRIRFIAFYFNSTVKLIILYISTSTSLLPILGAIVAQLIHLLVHSIDKSHAYTLRQSSEEKRNRTGAADNLQ